MSDEEKPFTMEEVSEEAVSEEALVLNDDKGELASGIKRSNEEEIELTSTRIKRSNEEEIDTSTIPSSKRQKLDVETTHESGSTIPSTESGDQKPEILPEEKETIPNVDNLESSLPEKKDTVANVKSPVSSALPEMKQTVPNIDSPVSKSLDEIQTDLEADNINVENSETQDSTKETTVNTENSETLDSTNKPDENSVSDDKMVVEDQSVGSEVKTKKEENKENIQDEPVPMDLSQTKVNGSSDVIMLSDLSDEDEGSVQMNGLVNGHEELTPEKLKERQKLIKRLQEELRNEEAKLVLLKKLRQSQMLGHMQDNGSQQQNKQQRPTQNAPPPLVRNSQNVRPVHNHKMQLPPQGYNNRIPPPQHRSHTHAPPPLVMGPRGSSHQQGHQNSRPVQNNSSSTQNIMQGYRPPAPPPAPPQPPPQPEQTPAQRQAAAKLALRKQLEKTLLQIPPPKPPPPEMNFIPSLGSGEFIMMCGLEEVVTFIKEADARKRGESPPDVKYVFNPFVCVQCKTDFTPVWKREKPGSKNVICENCVTSNQKKALKQEHTNRLKSAFVKALQQEQEIEQKIQQQQQQQSSTPVTVATTQQQSQPQQQPPSAHAAHSSSASQRGMSRTASEPYLAHQNMIQAHQASLCAAPMLQGFPRAMFPYGQPPKSVSDLQRQYLLDMIPRSLPQGMWQNK